MLFKALTLPDQRPLQDYTSLLVPLTVLCSKLVDPTELAVAVLAADVSHHMPAGKHHSVLHLAILQVHYLVEEESSACGSCETCGDKLGSVRQDGVTVGTGEEACSANVVQEDTSHCSIFWE